MKEKEFLKVLKKDREVLMRMLDMNVQYPVHHVSTQPRQDDDAESRSPEKWFQERQEPPLHDDAESWSLKEALEYSNKVEEQGRRQMEVRFTNYDKVCKDVSRLASGSQKMHKRTSRRIDRVEKAGEKNKDVIVKLKEQNQALSTEVQKERDKRKKLQKKVADLERVLVLLTYCAGIALPGDSLTEINRRMKGIYKMKCSNRIKRQGVLDYIDDDYKEVK